MSIETRASKRLYSYLNEGEKITDESESTESNAGLLYYKFP